MRPGAGVALFSGRRFRQFTVGAAFVIAVLVVGVVIHDAGLPGAADCPSAAFVKSALAQAVGSPSASADTGLLSCTYRVGSDPDAVSIDASAPGRGDPADPGDPCTSRPPIPSLGRHACDMTGTQGAGRPGSSVLVQPASHPGTEIQFTSDSARISLAQLERLAAKTLATRPLPITA